jgi:hypothetical protein
LRKKDASDYSAAVVEGELLTSAIVEVKANYNKENEQFQELKNSVGFLTELQFYQAVLDAASLRWFIESLERDISAIGLLPDREILASITANASSQQTRDLYLLDFGEMRLRQLVDAQRQRIRTAEQRLECVSVVIDQIGRITNLLEKDRQFQDENEKLKVRKLRFSAESMVRPPRLRKCKSATIRAFLIALQNELAVVRAAVKDAQQASEDNIESLRATSTASSPTSRLRSSIAIGSR